MHGVGLISGALCLVTWLYLLATRGRFWQVRRLDSPVPPAPIVGGIIAVVIPARDEADVIGMTVESLLQQTCAEALRIFVVDDHSSDGTADVVRRAALAGGRPEWVEVVSGAALPAGWTGKLWAVQQGVERALKLQPRFLLLTDADIRHDPNNIATLVAIAEAGDCDLASFMVKLHCRSFAERLLIPAFVFFFFMLYPPEWIRDERRRTAGAAGGCMLIRPQALQKAGGMAAIRDQIIDDCALARAVKHSGGRVWLGVTPDTASTRAYTSFDGIERMIARTAFNQLQHSTVLLAGSMVGLAIGYLVPVVLLVGGDAVLVALGAASWLLMAMAYAPMVRYYGLSAGWALTLPAAAIFYMGATIHSAVKFWSGRGGEWKGRAQDSVGTGFS
ncbi:MAG TPA: glycosyltransferase [Candidatus Angelobacter sp.]|nr:glycosyltransferase [Candidatus Angelobacter sp.]